jgi:transposase
MEEAVAANDAIRQYIIGLEKANLRLQETNRSTIIQFEKQVAELEQHNKTLEQDNKTLEQENDVLREKLKLALFRRFGRHAERFSGEGQLPLFDGEEGAADEVPEEPKEQETVKSYQRTKRGRKPIDENIPRADEVIDIGEGEKQCGCGSPLVCIGEDIIERLVIIPEQVYVIRYHVKKYACHECEGSGDEENPAVRTGKVPENIIPGSIATPELLSYVFTKKYCDYVPYYRQEGAFSRIGVSLSRQNMANWQQKVCQKLQPLLGLMKEGLRKGNVVQMDETPMAVMEEAGRENSQKSTMWLSRGGPAGKPVLWYEYRETKEKKHIGELLGGFSGYLQSDGNPSYESAVKKDLPGVIHVGCFAHVRRKFYEAMKIAGKPGLADEALAQIKGLYAIERELRERLKNKEIGVEKFTKERRERSGPVLSGFHRWLEEQTGRVPESGKIGEAIGYALREWHTLERYVEDWQLTPDNNACERGIRPFVMGRKNWVMSGSPAGAKSSCELYTLIETARANGWNPFKYMSKIFQKAAAMKPSDDWSQLLPWNIPP